MSKVAITGNAAGTGTFTIAAPGTNTDRTITLPDQTGTLVMTDAQGNLGLGVTPSAWPGAAVNYNTFQFGVSAVTNVANDAAELSYNQYIDSGGTRRYISTKPALRYRMGITEHQWFTAPSGTAGSAISFNQAMTLDTSGTLLVGATSAPVTGCGAVFQHAGNFCSVNRVAGTGTAYMVGFYNTNGLVGRIETGGSATSYVTSSDYRLKTNVQPMQNALGKVMQLNPVTYNWKVDGTEGQGFIAHELQAVVPDCVTGEKDAVDADGKPVYQGIDTSFLVATLTAAIQELKAIVDQQAQRITALEGTKA